MRYLKHHLRVAVGKFVHRGFPFFEKMGFHITPRHFYQPIPTLTDLADEIWEKPSELPGLKMNESEQVNFLNHFVPRFKPEYDRFGVDSRENGFAYYSMNGTFGESDGDVLYSMIRHFKPAKVVEIGCGWSTLLATYAIEKNLNEGSVNAQLTCIEPYPPSFLRELGSKINLIEKKVQKVDLEVFESLSENDILFIDSSHVSKINSDVNYEFLEVLPRLKKGVVIHVHDIFFPFEYPKTWVRDHLIFWNEMYLLQAFLAFNDTFEIIWAGNWLKWKHPESFQRVFRRGGAQSFWIRKLK